MTKMAKNVTPFVGAQTYIAHIRDNSPLELDPVRVDPLNR